MRDLHVPGTMLCLVAFLSAVAITDWRTRRIPNLLTVPAAAVGMGLNLAVAGGFGGVQAGLGLLVGLAAFLPLYLAGWFGAGDVKAMAAIGAFVGPKGAFLAAGCSLMAGALGALLLLVCLGEFAALADLARRWLLRAHSLYAIGQAPRLSVAADDATRRRFPFGLAIACGTIISLAWS